MQVDKINPLEKVLDRLASNTYTRMRAFLSRWTPPEPHAEPSCEKTL